MRDRLRKAGLRATSAAVHRLWRLAGQAGSVTALRPGPYRFAAIGAGTRLAFPQGTIFGEGWMELGEHGVIGQDVTLSAGLAPGHDLGPEPLIRIGDGVVIGRGGHIVALAPITVGDDVFFGPHCYVTSTNHSYDDPAQPVGHQWPRAEPVVIGAGSWLGAGVTVLPGARLGRNVVVAAGAVVRGEVPDHTVVAGVPARQVRRWHPGQGWRAPSATPPAAPATDATPWTDADGAFPPPPSSGAALPAQGGSGGRDMGGCGAPPPGEASSAA